MGSERIAVFLATSGHSGVDRVMGNLLPEMARQGVRVDLLKIRGHGPRLNDTPPGLRSIDLGVSHVNSALPRLAAYLLRKRPRAILTDKDRVNRISILAGLMTGMKSRVVVRMGTTVSENLRRRSPLSRHAQLLSIRLLYPRAHRVLVPSEGARDDLIAIAPSLAGSVRVVSSPIIDRGFRSRASAPLEHPWFQSQDVPVILGVGELCERKDFATLMKGFALASAEREMRLVILGEGKKRKMLLELAEGLGIQERVDMPGFAPNPLPYMAAASCFCMTSRCEGLPVALVEALACGTPAVATDCPSGPREVLAGTGAGILVPVGDPAAVADALLRLLSSPPPAEQVKAAASRFTVENGTREYLRELLG